MTDTPTPDWLRPGDLVGPWRIEGYAGRGSYGVVFRARRAGHPGSAPGALKVAQIPDDPRFAREVGLLSRIHHPSVPQLLDRGMWRSSTGTVHPYFVMEWIRGQTLYEWARRHNPTSRQVMKVVAQLAWGLEVVHRAEGLHRDVRGDNILVDPEGRAVLTDFGSCTWRGAPPLTERVMPPNTPEYRSPEAVRFAWENWRNKEAHYEARPTDDLYALGVSIYRLVTGVYPPPGTDPEAREHPPFLPLPLRLLPQALNGRVAPELASLIDRLMAKEPEARGGAQEAAVAAEFASKHARPEADVPLVDPARQATGAVAVGVQVVPESELEQPVVEVESVPVQVIRESGSERPAAGAHDLAARRLLDAALLILAVMGISLAVQGLRGPRFETAEVARVEAPEVGMAPDAGTRGLGEEVLSARVDSQEPPPASKPISKKMPKQPLPGQRRPPCGRNKLVILHGGCWRRQDVELPCAADEYEWQNSCYLPEMEQTRPPTTEWPQ